MRRVQRQIRNCETSVATHSFVDLKHQIIIHQRWTPTSRLIVKVLSSFIEHPKLFPNYAITHRIVTIRLTDLVMNLTGSTLIVFKKRITDLFHSRRPLQLS